MSNYRKKIVSCFDIGEAPTSPGKWKWNRLSFLPFIFSFEQCVILCMQFQNSVQQAATHYHVYFSNLGESTKVFQNTVNKIMYF